LIPARLRGWAAVHVATLVAGAAALAYLGRGAWFFYDEWDIVGNHSLSLLQPHNEHWSTLPYLVYQLLYPVVGLREYMPYLAVVIALHLGATHLLWRLLRREGVNDWVATLLAASFLVYGPGAENLYWAWQMGFLGAVFCGLAAVLLGTAANPSRRRDALTVLALVAGLMCSGIGVTMVLVTGLAVWSRRGWRPAALLVALPVLAFIAWYAAAGHAVSRTYVRPGLAPTAEFVGEGLAATAELGYDFPLVGAALVLAAVAWAAWHLPRQRHRFPFAIAGILGVLALFTQISLGRLQYGPEAATQGRYVYVAAVLLVPAAGLAIHWISLRGRGGLLAAGVLLAFALVHNGEVLVVRERDHRAASQLTRDRVLAAAARVRAAGAGFDVQQRPDPASAPTLTLARVSGFIHDGAMPAGN
jgi:hypothetical protein